MACSFVVSNNQQGNNWDFPYAAAILPLSFRSVTFYEEKKVENKCISGLPWDISTTTSGQTTSSATSAGTIFAFIIVHYVVTDFVVVVAVVLVVPKRDLQEGKSAIRNRCNQRKREWTNMFLYRCTHTHARTALCYCMCFFLFSVFYFKLLQKSVLNLWGWLYEWIVVDNKMEFSSSSFDFLCPLNVYSTCFSVFVVPSYFRFQGMPTKHYRRKPSKHQSSAQVFVSPKTN